MDPWFAILAATLPVLLVAWLLTRTWVRRRERRAIRGFEAAPRTSSEEFLASLSLEDDEEADLALKLRAGLAMLGSIPPDALQSSHRFYPDLEWLPYYDSPDFLELVLLIEHVFELPVPEGDDERTLLSPVQKGSVAEFIRNALEWRRRQPVAEPTS